MRQIAAPLILVALGACAQSDANRAQAVDTPASTPGIVVTGSGTLHLGAASVCDRGSSIRAEARQGESTFRLNLRPVDSTEVVRALVAANLGSRPYGQRVVQVEVDSSRSDDLVPLLGAIGRGGGLAFLPDTACAPLPQREVPRA